tara:strand:- start:841 stop:2229 length:1389 start_codon:yes stop_codon:yes gene_type:complete
MAVTFSTLFARLGKIFGMAETIRSQMGTLRTEYADVISQYSDADMYMVGDLTRDIETRINDADRLLRILQRGAETTLIEMVDNDLVSSNGGGVPQKNVATALRELIRQMAAGSSSVDGTTITIATPSSFGTGRGSLVVSGLASQVFAPTVVDYASIVTELVRVRCVADANDPTVSEASERFLILGQRAEAHLDDEWPKGSGTNVVVNAASPDYEQGVGPGNNVLRNSNFENFTSNTPDGWIIATGSAGSDVVEDSSAFRGSKCLEIDADGSTAVKLTQSFNTASGTLGRLKPDTPYTISFAVKKTGSLTAGQLKVYVTDGSAVLNNSDSNRKMEISLDYNTVGAITDSYQIKTLDCMTPASISKGSYIVIETSTAFNSGVSIFIDDLCLAEMHRPIPGGLAYQIIPGATRFTFDDESTVQITNNAEGKFATDFNRFFNMDSKGFGLPSNYGGSETINDNLIS